MPKSKNSNATFWVIFKQCDGVPKKPFLARNFTYRRFSNARDFDFVLKIIRALKALCLIEKNPQIVRHYPKRHLTVFGSKCPFRAFRLECSITSLDGQVAFIRLTFKVLDCRMIYRHVRKQGCGSKICARNAHFCPSILWHFWAWEKCPFYYAIDASSSSWTHEHF